MKSDITPRNILFFLILLLAFSLVLTIVVKYRGGELELLPAPVSTDVDVSLKKIALTNSRDGIPTWKLVADTVDFDAQTKSGHLSNIHVTFLGSEQGDLILTADEGELAVDGKIMKVQGNVIVKGSQGYTFYSDTLEYQQVNDLIVTQSPVRVISEGLEVRGRGLMFNVKERSLRILEKVKAEIVGTSKKNEN